MGKDSLIKSTSKKKNASSKKDEEGANVKDKQAKAPKKSTTKAKTGAKASPKKTKAKGKAAAPAKTKAAKKAKAAKPKTTAKKTTAAKSKTVAAKKAADNKAAAEKAAAEKAAAEKAAAEKAAAEKAAAEKAAAEKAAAEKAAAEKAAAEKAAAEKAAAEKAAAEKAAAEKAAAEKAAAEKAAAEKAAAEKAAAEKAAAEKAAQEPKPSISYAPPPDAAKPTGSAGRPLQIAIGLFALLIFLIVSASYVNKKHYYLKTVNGAIEVWQGKFAPKGTRLLVSLPGERLDAPAKEVYSRQEIYPLIFAYYKDKAITLMDVKGMPDFETVKFYLEQALCYSTTPKEKADVNAKINGIDFMVLMSKADAAMSKMTIASHETALQYLGQAGKLDLEDFQEEQVNKKAALAKTTLDELKQKEKKAKEAAQEAKKAQTAKMAAAAKKKDDAEKTTPE